MNDRDRIRQLDDHYRSGAADLGSDFFIPCLSCCQTYRRLAGFFTSSSLLEWADTLLRVIVGEGPEIRMVISPHLQPADREALRSATSPTERQQLRQQAADSILRGAVQAIEGGGTISGAGLLAWLIANDRLCLRLAFPNHVDDPGLFHEKMGVFTFSWGDRVAFTGSANETRSGYHLNYESVDVYRSWLEGEHQRISRKEEQFEEVWSRNAFGLDVHDPSPELLDWIREHAPQECPSGPRGYPPPPERKPDATPDKWRHQDDAIAAFMEAKRGVLEMATGTGKTWTALRILGKLLEQGAVDGAIVCTAGNDLLDQWSTQLGEWAGTQAQRLRVVRQYSSNKEVAGFLFRQKNAILVSSRLELPKVLHQLRPRKRRRLLIIHDEIHGLGSPSMVRDLAGEHQHFSWALGLSATPEREYDAAGSAFITEEVGEVVYTFGLEHAIEREILCEFDYVPLEYELTEDDRRRLQAVYKKQAARKNAGNPMTQEEVWIELSRVYKTAEQKPGLFARYIELHPDTLSSCIVFVETREFGEQLLEAIHRKTHRFHTYYAEDDRDNLRRFARGEVKCLITCHRISEGIDIRHLQNVVLVSSARARLETIQRIGRCLRTDPQNPEKRARVIDFVCGGHEADSSRRDWLRGLASVMKSPGSESDA